MAELFIMKVPPSEIEKMTYHKLKFWSQMAKDTRPKPPKK
jgi:hypothetical protein